MATLPFTPITARVQMRYLWNNEPCMNVFHVKATDNTTPPDVGLIAGIFANWYSSNFKGAVSNDASLQEIVVTDLTSDVTPQIVYTTGLPEAGSVGSDSVANNVAPIVVWDTGVRRRGTQGRTFVIGAPESYTDGQLLISSAVTGYHTAFAALTAALAAATTPYTLGLVSYYGGGVIRTLGLFLPFNQFTVDTQLGSLRTRLTGRRRKKRRP